MKKAIIIGILYFIAAIFILIVIFNFIALCFNKDIEFNGDIYRLKYSNCTIFSKTCENKYYKKKENNKNWTQFIKIVYSKTDDFHALSQTMKAKNKTSFWIENKVEYDILNFYDNNKSGKFPCIEHNVVKTTHAKEKKGVVSIHIVTKIPTTGKTKKSLKNDMLLNAMKISKPLAKTSAPKVFKTKVSVW